MYMVIIDPFGQTVAMFPLPPECKEIFEGPGSKLRDQRIRTKDERMNWRVEIRG